MIVIKGRLPGLNEYTNACRKNRFTGAKFKKEWQRYCALHMLRQKPIEECFIVFKWHEQDKRRDKDNIAFAKKFILDAMQEVGILNNDGWGEIKGFRDEFYIDKTYPRVEVEVLDNELFEKG